MKRASLTPKQRAAKVADQRGACACGCGRPLGRRFVAEHLIPVAIGNTAKPDCLLREDCAALKTKGDLKDIWRAKRRAGEAGQAARRSRRIAAGKPSSLIRAHISGLQGRGFDKARTRGFDGKVRKR